MHAARDWNDIRGSQEFKDPVLVSLRPAFCDHVLSEHFPNVSMCFGAILTLWVKLCLLYQAKEDAFVMGKKLHSTIFQFCNMRVQKKFQA